MTQKKKDILTSALRLFVEHGYNGTSTRQIGKEAGVSEALIFRHYGNKEGLLKAILEAGRELIESLSRPILNQNDPKSVIHQLIELPLSLVPDDESAEFWPLLMDMKHRNPHAKAMMHNSQTLAELQQKMLWAFTKLNFSHPELELNLMWIYVDGISRMLKSDQKESAHSLIEYLKTKYDREISRQSKEKS